MTESTLRTLIREQVKTLLKEEENNKQVMLSKWFEDFKNEGPASDHGYIYGKEWGENKEKYNQEILNRLFTFSSSGLKDRPIVLDDLKENGIFVKMIKKYGSELVKKGLMTSDEYEDTFKYHFDFPQYFDLFKKGSDSGFGLFSEEELDRVLF